MNKKQIKQFNEILKGVCENFDLDVAYYIDEDNLKDVEDIDDLENYLDEINEDSQVTDEEVIYYSNAIEILQEHDPSLNESMSLASELGYTTENINSELLATLLISQLNRDDYYTICKDVLSQCDDMVF